MVEHLLLFFNKPKKKLEPIICIDLEGGYTGSSYTLKFTPHLFTLLTPINRQVNPEKKTEINLKRKEKNCGRSADLELGENSTGVIIHEPSKMNVYSKTWPNLRQTIQFSLLENAEE